jgi:cytokinesis protein
VASGQKIQDMASLVKSPDNIEASLLSPTDEASGEAIDEAADSDVAPENLKDEDIADRAASLLEGLRGETGTEEDEDGKKMALPREDSIRVRRRRESAQDERAARRRRRRQQASSATETTLGQPPIAEDAENENDSEQPDDSEMRQSSSSREKPGYEEESWGMKPTTPVTIVHPPSPGNE